MTKLALAVLLTVTLGVVAYAQTKPKSVYKIFHLTPSTVGIYCQNGADPTALIGSAKKIGDLLIISCGR